MRKFIVGLVAVLAFSFCRADEVEDRFNFEMARVRQGYQQKRLRDPLLDQRLARLSERLQMKDVSIVVLPADAFDGLATYFPGVIVLSTTLMQENDEVLSFALAHEYGHHTAKHWRLLLSGAMVLARERQAYTFEGVLRNIQHLSDRRMLHAFELDADASAKRLLVRLQAWQPEAVRHMLNAVAAPQESDQHPSPQLRLEKLGLK